MPRAERQTITWTLHYHTVTRHVKASTSLLFPSIWQIGIPSVCELDVLCTQVSDQKLTRAANASVGNDRMNVLKVDRLKGQKRLVQPHLHNGETVTAQACAALKQGQQALGGLCYVMPGPTLRRFNGMNCTQQQTSNRTWLCRSAVISSVTSVSSLVSLTELAG